ncbi:hypothetical protein LSAT2_015816 [Lamellibrachia satsuma]|nr:hypothetical protein LSAT2_015816 [Lamellibrachia satsuma]
MGDRQYPFVVEKYNDIELFHARCTVPKTGQSNDRHDCGDSQSLLAKDTPETHGATEATGVGAARVCSKGTDHTKLLAQQKTLFKVQNIIERMYRLKITGT